MNFLKSFYLPFLHFLFFAPPYLLAIDCVYMDSPPLFSNPYVEDEKLKRGQELHEAGLYTQAIEAYDLLINDPIKENPIDTLELLMETRFHLAYLHFTLSDYQKSCLTLEENLKQNFTPNSLEAECIYKHSVYLKALCLKNLNLPLIAKSIFLDYLRPSSSTLTLYDEAIFEIGLINFLQKNYHEAIQNFESLKIKESKPRLFALAQIYLAHIAQIQKHPLDAIAILDPLSSLLSNKDPLLFEINYLKGEAAFKLQDYSKAIEYFKFALPHTPSEKKLWHADTLYHLGWSYLKIGDDPTKQRTEQIENLEKSEQTFKELLSLSENEKNYLALAQVYLSQGNHLKQASFYAKAEELLSKEGIYTSQEAQDHALFLRAEAASSYTGRNKFYLELTEKGNDSNIFFAKGWFMRALNDFHYGQQLKSSENPQESLSVFERASLAFRKSFELLLEKEPEQAAIALKYEALAMGDSQTHEANLKAFKILESLMQTPHLWQFTQHKDEIHYLHGFFASSIAKEVEKEQYLQIARQSLLTAASIPHNIFGDRALLHLGNLYYQNQNFERAEETYLQLIKNYPHSLFAAEALLWAAFCADNLQKDPGIGKERRQYAYQHFPDSPHAAEAYFTYFTYPEYIQGDKTALKHLQAFIDTYSESPFLIDAHFLIGLDNKRDRKTVEGKWIHKKNLTDAIDSFQKAEILFEEFYEKKLIPCEKLDYYTAMRYRATFERAIANLAIAEESQGAKRQIYLDYAKEVLTNLLENLKIQKNFYLKKLYQESSFPLIDEESSFWLAQTHIKANQDQEANHILSNMIERYEKENQIKGYYLAKALDEQGKIAMRTQNYQNALQLFKKAEEAAKGNLFSTDQKLELWIEQSLCYRQLQQFDEAILILSKVINHDAISGLRINAMYLRAEIYELQKRPELARKQLESIVKKGGMWAKKAQEKLDKDDFNGY